MTDANDFNRCLCILVHFTPHSLQIQASGQKLTFSWKEPSVAITTVEKFVVSISIGFTHFPHPPTCVNFALSHMHELTKSYERRSPKLRYSYIFALKTNAF